MEAAAWNDAPAPEAVLAATPPSRPCVLLHDADALGRSALLWDADAVHFGVLCPDPAFLGASRGMPARRWALADHDPAERLQRAMDEERWDWPAGAPVFGPAWAGWWGFACGHAWEPFPWTPRATPDDPGAGLPDYHWARYRQALVWDAARGAMRWWDARPGASDRMRDAERTAVEDWLRRAAHAGRHVVAAAQVPPLDPPGDGADYRAAVARLRAWIGDGELFQANLSVRREGTAPADPRAAWGALSRRQPTRMGAYWQDGEGASLLSHSPERFLRVRGTRLETCPIKGTAARGTNARDDDARARALEASEKERAELTMIVDMARNDLGRVALSGSVSVPSTGRVERYPTLLHRTARVQAQWDPSVGLAALMRATFPPASVTGAPKVRALQAIAELERVPRGPYCGALGWWSPGRLPQGDASVLIRSAAVARGRTILHVGAGIVWDSDPAREWEETLVKARYWEAGAAAQ